MAARRLAYTTDLTDEAWQMLAPSCRRNRLAVDLVNIPCVRCAMACRRCCAPAVPGA
jgi:hypothetical protein